MIFYIICGYLSGGSDSSNAGDTQGGDKVKEKEEGWEKVSNDRTQNTNSKEKKFFTYLYIRIRILI